MRTFMRSTLLSVIICAVVLAAAGCNEQKSSPSGRSKISLSGTIDPGSITVASAKPQFVKRMFAFFRTGNAYAALPSVSKIVAVSSDNSIVTGTISGDTFSLALDTGKQYLVVFLDGTTIVGIYKVDTGTGLDVFPLSSGSVSMNLGTVSLSGGVLTGTITPGDLLSGLGIDPSLAAAIGVMDDGYFRFGNIDVDGNGVIDVTEGKRFGLSLDYEFSPGQSFSSLSAASSFSSRTNVTYGGYEYGFGAFPDDAGLNWSTARLISPSAIDDGSGAATSKSRCYFDSQPYGVTLNFYCDRAKTPYTPPAGDYQVLIDLHAGGTRTLTFKNVRSQTIDSANLYNIYIPEVKLTMDGNGKVQQVAWQWWKKVNGVGWVQPTTAELEAVLDIAGFLISDSLWNGGVPVRTALTPTGVVQSPAQSFVPGHFRFTYRDKAQYGYGIQW